MSKFIKIFIGILLPSFIAIMCLRLAFNDNHKASFNINDALSYFGDDSYDFAQQAISTFNDIQKFYDAPKPHAHYPYYYGKQYGYYMPTSISADFSRSDEIISFMSSTMDSDEEVDFPYYQERYMQYDKEIVIQFGDSNYITYTYVNWKHNPFDAVWVTGKSTFASTYAMTSAIGSLVLDAVADVIHYVGFIPYIISVE